jgi:SAM-dependent methyltransferase
MLTVDFDRFETADGLRVLDLGCGAGRHAFEAFRRGGCVVALDRCAPDLAGVATMFAAMAAEGRAPASARAGAVRGDALALPFADATFDLVIAAEILEHLPDDVAAVAELARVLRPGGLAAVTVPRWLPEKICWALSSAYHDVEGGHVRIYRARGLRGLLRRAGGLRVVGGHHAHALHAPYWWLRCLVGVHDDDHPATRAYHRLLVWDMMRRPWPTRLAEAVLDPIIGKSVVLYLRKPYLRKPLAEGTDPSAEKAAEAAMAQEPPDGLPAEGLPAEKTSAEKTVAGAAG